MILTDEQRKRLTEYLGECYHDIEDKGPYQSNYTFTEWLLFGPVVLQSGGGVAGGEEMKWVAVKDRLPEKSGKYTVKTVEGSISPHEHERVLFGKLYPDGFMFHEGDWQHVTHWLEEKK